MRILVINNRYPPLHVGGYEVVCHQAVEGLRARGHEVRVLTSTYRLENPESDGQVYRWLLADFDRPFSYRRLWQQEMANRAAFERLAAEYRPEAVYAGNLAHISFSLVLLAQRRGIPVHYLVGDQWLSRWEDIDAWHAWWASEPRGSIKGSAKRLLRQSFTRLGLVRAEVPDFRRVQFLTHYLKQEALSAGKPVAGAAVIHWGVDPAEFPYRAEPHTGAPRLLYHGEVVPHKGVHTAIEALRLLRDGYGRTELELTVSGGTVVPHYLDELRERIHAAGLEGRVHFLGFVPARDLPRIYREHDILVFPSILPEGFGIVPIEAMSAGLAVVGAAPGGSAEVLRDGENALLFPSEDAAACAAQIERLLADPTLMEKLRRQGRQSVEEHFCLDRAIDAIDRALREAVQG